MKNRIRMAAGLLCALFVLPAICQQQLGPIAVKGNITATGDVYAGGSSSTNKACTPANGLCGGAPTTVTGIRYGNGASPDTAATNTQIATALNGATLTNNTSGTAANVSGTPALPNGTSATTQGSSDNTTAVATDAFVQSVKATIPTTTMINTVSCTTGSSCTIPTTCAGVTCPNGTQVAVSFTTSANLAITANVLTTDTTFTVSSTTGYPSIGCGLFDNGGGNQEYFCWSGKDATHFSGLTRGVYGSTALSALAANSPSMSGLSNTLSTSISSIPTWVQFNNGVIKFTTNINIQSYGIIGGTFNGVVISTSLSAASPFNATSSANANSAPLNLTGNAWNGSASVADTWQWVNVLGTGSNPTTTLTLSHPSGSTGAATVAIPYQMTGPLAAPTGTCAIAGAWVFSQDGHATFCPSSGGTWTTKI